jgi:transposase InsO family protein
VCLSICLIVRSLDTVLRPHKVAALVSRAFATVKGDFRQIQWFHTDRGSEFKNQNMDELLSTFNIGRSLSIKVCPYDNAVAEATFKVMKTEFVRWNSRVYVTWNGSCTITSTGSTNIGFMELWNTSPLFSIDMQPLKKLFDLLLTIQEENKDNDDIIYRAINAKDLQRLINGQDLEGKNPYGLWTLTAHVAWGSKKLQILMTHGFPLLQI